MTTMKPITDRLDRFDLIAELARGGTATVFLARLAGDGGFQRLVAIKRLHPHLAREDALARTVLREAGLLQSARRKAMRSSSLHLSLRPKRFL